MEHPPGRNQFPLNHGLGCPPRPLTSHAPGRARPGWWCESRIVRALRPGTRPHPPPRPPRRPPQAPPYRAVNSAVAACPMRGPTESTVPPHVGSAPTAGGHHAASHRRHRSSRQKPTPPL